MTGGPNTMDRLWRVCDEVASTARLMAFACNADNRGGLLDADVSAIIESANALSARTDEICNLAEKIREERKEAA